MTRLTKEGLIYTVHSLIAVIIIGRLFSQNEDSFLKNQK